MEPFDNNSIQLELKYCERCGGLGCALKAQTWCSARHARLQYLGLIRTRGLRIRYSRRPGPRHSDKVQVAFWSEGGNA
jgi:hypothetical protein